MRLDRLICLTISALVSGCLVVPAPLDVTFNQTGSSVSLRSHEAVAIVPGGISSPFIEEAVACLMEAMRTKYPTLRIISAEEFRHSVFDYRPPEEARGSYMELLHNHPATRERVHALHIRYVFFVEGGTRVDTRRSSLLRVYFYEVGRSDLVAQLVGSAAGRVSPIPIVAPPSFALIIQPIPLTETRLCAELEAEIEQFVFVNQEADDTEPLTTAGEAQVEGGRDLE